MGHNGSNTPNHPNSHNGRSGLDRPPQPTPYPLGVEQGAMEPGVMTRATKGLAQPIHGTQFPSNALGARGGTTWQGNALPLH